MDTTGVNISGVSVVSMTQSAVSITCGSGPIRPGTLVVLSLLTSGGNLKGLTPSPLLQGLRKGKLCSAATVVTGASAVG